MNRYHGSKAQLEDHLREAEEYGGDTDCGGWTWDPPCGGCTTCFRRLAHHYWEKERERIGVLQTAGFEVADPSLIDTQLMSYGGVEVNPDDGPGKRTRKWVGLGTSHDSYNCWCAKERTELSWPWSKPV